VTINVTSVIYYQIIDPKNATYQVANRLAAMEQLTQTTLRNVMGGLTLDIALTSRDQVNGQLRMVLDEVTEKWGVRVNRVELRDIIPPHDVQQAMEKQMQAEREKRASILRAEGQKQAAILQAEGDKQAAILQAEGDRQSAILQAQGEAEALVTMQQAQAKSIDLVFSALALQQPTPEILKYLYIQNLPKLAEGTANKLFVVPSELENIASLGATFSAAQSAAPAAPLDLSMLDRLVKEFDLRLAIHNHGPENKRWPRPQDGYAAVKTRDRRLGLCIDIGHTLRTGTDPVQAYFQRPDFTKAVAALQTARAARHGGGRERDEERLPERARGCAPGRDGREPAEKPP